MDFLMQPPVIISTTATIVVMFLYVVLLYKITGKDKSADKLIWAFAGVSILGIIYHLVIFSKLAETQFEQYDNWVFRLLFAVQYSLEMFLTKTIVYKKDVFDVLSNYKLLFHGYLILYGVAILTSGFAVFHFLSRRIYTRRWLNKNKVDATVKTHIFVGINESSIYLAENIKNLKDQKNCIIFIDIPNQQDDFKGMSKLDIIARFFKHGEKDKRVADYVVLRAGRGIDKIKKWLKPLSANVYILSDNQEENIAILEKLWKFQNDGEHSKDKPKGKIYCHAKREGLVNRYAGIADYQNKIKFVDSSFLAVEELKKEDAKLLPVHYVKIASDKDNIKRKLGYVESSFNCAVVGAGETGLEATKFLYEFGAFPDAENGKAPFKCHLFDRNFEKVLGEFSLDVRTLRSTATKDDEFELHSCCVGTNAFRSEIRGIIKDLNYVVVSLGDDNLNVETALNIAEWAIEEGRDPNDKFCIAVRLTEISKLNEDTIAEANKAFGNCIKTFGQRKNIWKLNIISNHKLDADARTFYESYKEHSDKLNEVLEYGPNPTWDEREENLINGTYKERCDIRRKKAQDYSNSLHKTTKRILCGGNEVDIKEQILEANDGKIHCKGDCCEILEHLAVCEHLRWEASHMILGYRPVEKNGDPTNVLQKRHKCITTYAELEKKGQELEMNGVESNKNEYYATIHYDWLVVKNSFSENHKG